MMNPKNRIAAAILTLAGTLVLLAPVRGHADADPMRLCTDERRSASYASPGLARPGELQANIEAAARDLGMRATLTPLPWRRCLELMRAGEMDGAVGIAFLPFTQEIARFPMQAGQVDKTRALGVARIVLVRRAGSDVAWNGPRLGHAGKPVAVAAGMQAIIDAVRHAGGEVDYGAKTDELNLKKLVQGRADLAAGYEYDLAPLIREKYAGEVEMGQKSLRETHYYLAFSHRFHDANAGLAERMWNRLKEIRR
ncbi:substrate-binding periplasmic protein [Noviherbaspirillum galbum]|uniref:Transporter substrate-binding domain-containing protein n=1 Tax=Noviherbaspirillum galbum TaxID=2709383 RepID=A0A6B3SJZ4_9BURK|nr:transporter substrate-binding domain-containing protein [Noviherbaspirillum galbum]NEX61121.1 transporter substrate-binding domain-containing protein [Noviherbaspirillum galbum]